MPHYFPIRLPSYCSYVTSIKTRLSDPLVRTNTVKSGVSGVSSVYPLQILTVIPCKVSPKVAHILWWHFLGICSSLAFNLDNKTCGKGLTSEYIARTKFEEKQVRKKRKHFPLKKSLHWCLDIERLQMRVKKHQQQQKYTNSARWPRRKKIKANRQGRKSSRVNTFALSPSPRKKLFSVQERLRHLQSKRFLWLTGLKSTVMQRRSAPRLGLFSLRRTEEVQREQWKRRREVEK